MLNAAVACYFCGQPVKLKYEEFLYMSLVIYGKPDCPYCAQARAYYNEKGVEFVEYDAQHDKQRQREMLEYSGGDLVVPCIVENGEYVGSGWGNPRRG